MREGVKDRIMGGDYVISSCAMRNRLVTCETPLSHSLTSSLASSVAFNCRVSFLASAGGQISTYRLPKSNTE